METAGLKENFQNQLKEIDEKIEQIQGELAKAKEYKTKLVGGLETLELLEQQNSAPVTPPQPDGYTDPIVADDPNDPKYVKQVDKDTGKEEVVELLPPK